MNSRTLAVLLCCAALGLAACGGGGAGAPSADLAEAEAARDAAQAAEAAARTALETARAALENAQKDLADAGDPAARAALGETLTEVSGELEKTVMALAPADDETGARKATREALEATRTAIDSIAEAVKEAVPDAGPTAADAHTALDRAETAAARALGAIETAQGLLAAAPDAESSAALLQARNALLIAQLSLTPALRRELDATDAGAARLTAEASAKDTELRAAQARATEIEGQLQTARARATELEGRLKTATDAAPAIEEQLQTARARVTELEDDLKTERSRAETLAAEAARLTRLRAETLVFGDNVEMPAGNPRGSKIVRTRRLPDAELVFHEGFDASVGSTYGQQIKYTATGGGTYAPETPDPVVYAEDAGTILGAGDPATAHFPGRGMVFRGLTRATRAYNSSGAKVHALDVEGYERHRRLVVQGQRTSDNDAPSVSGAAADGLIRAEADKDVVYRNWDAVPQTSFRRYDDERGFTMRFGGTADGALIFGDLEPFAAKGGVAGDLERDNRTTDDIEISFGEPRIDPYGERGWWWFMEWPIPKMDLVRDDDGNPVTTTEAEGNYKWMSADGSTQQEDGDGNPLYVSLGDPVPGIVGGAYDAYLSNHAGAAAGADGVPGTADDAQRYLKYAAYGLFRFTDYYTVHAWPGRIQTFHYGFDAFDSDADTAAPPVPAAGEESIAATFAGRTAGWILLPQFADATSGNPAFDHCGAAGDERCRLNFVDRMVRLRGDVALTACIGGVGGTCEFGDGDDDDLAANRVAGTIGGFEYSLGAGGGWSNRNSNTLPGASNSIHGTFNVHAAIDPATGLWNGPLRPESTAETDGACTVRPDVNISCRMSDQWEPGRIEGAFYGPLDALEAAGTWQASARYYNDVHAGIVGSFGAACTDCGE